MVLQQLLVKCFSSSVTYLEDCVQKPNSICVRHLQLSINQHVEEVFYKDLVSEGYAEMKSKYSGCIN